MLFASGEDDAWMGFVVFNRLGRVLDVFGRAQPIAVDVLPCSHIGKGELVRRGAHNGAIL